MSEFQIPFVAAAALLPLAGAALVGRLRDTQRAHRWASVIAGVTLVCAIGAWQDFNFRQAADGGAGVAQERWNPVSVLFGGQTPLAVDELTAPLLPTIALLYFLTILATQKTKVRRVSFGRTLVAESVLLATFSAREPWLIVGLLALGTIPPYLELRRRMKPTRVYLVHMVAFVVLLVGGWALVSQNGGGQIDSVWILLPLLLAVLIRSGLVPVHCWLSDLFEHAAFGNTLLLAAPMTGAYAMLRLVVPVAPDWVLNGLGVVAAVTAVYAAGLSLVQREARRFFCYLFLSHSALVLVGLLIVNSTGMAGALCMWLSVGIGLGGLGLTLRALEARIGRLSLTEFRGLYEHTPALAICFVIAGLAIVGFPGTLGFIGTEMLLDGTVGSHPFVGVALLLAMALNSISLIRTYFVLFTGSRLAPSVSLRVGVRERFAVVVFAILLLGGGFYPQPGVASRYGTAERILSDRADRSALQPRPRLATRLKVDAIETNRR